MRSIIFVTLLLLLQLYSAVNGQFCTRTVPTKLSRTRMVTRYRWVDRQNWLGMTVSKKEPYTVPETEYYDGTKLETYCCNGYAARGSLCLPTCTPDCPINSHCVMPNHCLCYNGYRSSGTHPLTVECEPHCSSDCPPHSNCTLPEQCTCEPGYVMRANLCQPICTTGCPANADCTAPDTCTCRPGYEQNDAGECQPHCRNGCAPNAYCQQPNVCACRTGYRWTDDAMPQCAPICVDDCVAHSVCVAPNECRCLEGYAPNAATSQCEPICADACPAHSVCVAPNECRCDDGYQLQNVPQHLPYCEPLCAQDCLPNGKCVAPNVCECFGGYEMRNDSADGQTLCRPRCTPGCTHGICFAPELCVCDPGYLMGPHNSCEPTCTLGCTNGVCVEPEICACSPGYSFANNSVHICAANCTPDCINADCVGPDFCVCRDGYKPRTVASVDGVAVASAHECEPSCAMECVNGYCSAPNRCSCHDGYAPQLDAEGVCETQCTGCQFGKCTAPGVCQCWAGYVHRLAESTSEASIESGSANVCAPLESTTTTTEPISTDTSSEAPQLHHKVCNTQCKCWQPASESSALTHAKCAHICLDDYDQPCLNLTQCSCDAMQQRLVCTVAYELEELALFDQLDADADVSHSRLVHYSCKVLLSPTQRNELRANTDKAPETNSTLGLLIGGCVAGSVVLLAVVAVVWRYVHTRNPIGMRDVPLLTVFKK